MKKIKLDENFPPAMVDIFLKRKIDASSVYLQQLNGTDDDRVFDICINEGRALVTFDLDFANILRYPSDKTPGIIIARSKRKINLAGISSLCDRLATLIAKEDIAGKLFIVEETKVRVRKPDL
jgi:predicted nuclease of predicted toxin-antitoxin system